MHALLVLCALVPGFGELTDLPKKTTLTVTIQNVRAKTGTVRIALLKDCANFPECTPEYTAIIDAKNTSFQKSFSVEPGEYAVAVYHDRNGNGELDKRLFGIPKEPYGFSNNFRPRISAPTFDDCRISLSAADKEIRIRIE